MTPYERGYAAGLKAAAKEAKERAWDETGLCIDPDMDEFADYLLSLPIEGEATNPGEPLPDFDSLADIAAALEEHDAHR